MSQNHRGAAEHRDSPASVSFPGNRTAAWGSLLLCLSLMFSGCGGSGDSDPASSSASGDQEKRRFLSLGTAPTGGAFFVVGGALAQVLDNHHDNWDVTAEATKGSQENIRRLASGELDFALSNAGISYFAVRGSEGWEERYDVNAVMTLAPNVALFVAPAGGPVQAVEDLRGKRVVLGPAGAGFEYFLRPILGAHGLTYEDLTPIYNTQAGAVDNLADGSAAAAFLGGAVPTASITQAAATRDLHYVPFDEQARESLIAGYPFFAPATIPAGTYRGLEADYEGLNVGAMHLITSADADEEMVYQATRTLWENREEVALMHPAGRAIQEKNVVRDTGTTFHPGAVRFYREIGIWPTDDLAATEPATTDAN